MPYGQDPIAPTSGYGHDQTEAQAEEKEAGVKSGLSALWQGMLRGGRDLLQGTEQLAGKAGLPAIGAKAQAGQARMGAALDQDIKSTERSYQQNPAVRAHPIVAGAGRVAGNVLPSMALGAVGGPGAMGAAGRSAAGLIGRGAVSGAAGGAMQPVTSGDYWDEKMKQAGLGAAAGAALPGIGGAIAPRLLNPQVIGTAFPALRNFVMGAEERTIDGFDRTIARQVLDPIGASNTVGKNLSGHALASHTEDALSAAYDKIIPHVSLSRTAIANAATPETKLFISELDPLEEKQFTTFVKNRLLDQIGVGMMSGEAFKKAQRDFGSRAMSYLGTQKDALGRALLMMQSDLNDALARENPQWASELSKVNESWKMWARMRQAAAGATKTGKFTPQDFLRAVRQQDQTAGHRAFARGDAVLQGYAEAADKALATRSNPMDLLHIFSRHGLPMEMVRQTAGPAGRAAKRLTPIASGPAGAAAAKAGQPPPREPRVSVTGP